ncbi:hypothetical protein [Cellvibrio fontiphilus]|uniref:Lipoprotein n=1 Tax=Cellvibrio fontiphilus TaxID=1815559 RepID=A0ABV7FG78_9GAMM
MRFVILYIILISVAVLAYCRSDRFTDEQKISYFNKECLNAKEEIFSQEFSTSLALEYYPVSGVIEENYYPTGLAKKLLKSKRFEEVQLLYSSGDLSPTRAKLDYYCEGEFMIVARKEEDINLGLCGMVNGKQHYWVRQSKKMVSDYVVRYRYGERNEYDVRKFIFSIENYNSGEVIAMQSSYQLLLGKMSRKNQVLLGWGSAEGARSCPLTLPEEFVLSALNTSG